MHDEIIRYHLDGRLADVNIVSQRQRLIDFLEREMRDDGVAPSLDLEPQFTLDYDPETETFGFVLSIYGSYVGGSQSWQVEGITSGTMIMKHTSQTKLKGSSGTQR